MMRLVVDDEDVREVEQPQKHSRYRIPVSNSPSDTSDDDTAAPSPSRRRRKPATSDEPLKLAVESREAPAELPADTPAAAEEIDGPVEDAAEVEQEDSSAADTDVDLTVLEALLFGTHHPLTAPRLAELMELPSASPLRKAIKALNAQYEESKRSFRVEQVAGGYQLLTLPEYGEHLKRLHQREVDSRLTRAAVETLAIIAYKQPILRADVEAIRGVACGETIRSLMEKHLVRIAGRAEEPGRPILYGTTKRFLELFGLNSLKDLPQGEQLPPINP